MFIVVLENLPEVVSTLITHCPFAIVSIAEPIGVLIVEYLMIKTQQRVKIIDGCRIYRISDGYLDFLYRDTKFASRKNRIDACC